MNQVQHNLMMEYAQHHDRKLILERELAEAKERFDGCSRALKSVEEQLNISPYRLPQCPGCEDVHLGTIKTQRGYIVSCSVCGWRTRHCDSAKCAWATLYEVATKFTCFEPKGE